MTIAGETIGGEILHQRHRRTSTSWREGLKRTANNAPDARRGGNRQAHTA
jgi:hypothetical protein